ncbi:MAG: ureidoglycolate lyase, partial [Tistlia sp.]
IDLLERHPLSSRAFMPLGGRPWLVVVADTPRAETCRAFRVRGDQGVQYHPGVWHHPLLVLDEPQDFLVVERAGPGTNLEEVRLAAPLELRPA